MFFEIERDLFYEGLSKTVPIAEKRSPLPILSHILISVVNNTLTLTTTDLEVGLRMTYDAIVHDPGLLAIPSKKIYEIVRELPSGQVKIESTEANRIHISLGKIVFELAGMDASDYPVLPSFDETNKTEVNAQKLLDMIDKTLFAASSDDSRFNLNGVLFENDENKTRLVATDGHRLALIEEDLGISLDSQHVVPKKGLNELKRILESIRDNVFFGFEQKNLCVSNQKFLMSIRLVDGDYPDYRKVIPPSSDNSIKVNRISFLQALRRAAVLTSDRNKGVNVEINADTVVFSVTHPDLGSARDVLSVEYQGEDFLVIINVFYLMEALGVIDSELISFEFGKEAAPIIIRPEPQDNYFNLVMPMRK
ncbi:MAG: DNA polymerase III subunit beta [Desulfomonile sp.]